MQNSGTGQGRRGRGQGEAAGRRTGMGLGGECRCPNCGHREAHQRNVPCYNRACPKCNTPMVRA